MKNNIKSAVEALKALQQASSSLMAQVNQMQETLTDDEQKQVNNALSATIDISRNINNFKSEQDVHDLAKKYNL